MTDFETEARSNHRSGMNCAMAVYNALATVNENKTVPPKPRAELRGMLRNKCNDYVGYAAAMVAEMMNV